MKTKKEVIGKYYTIDNYRMVKFKFNRLPESKRDTVIFLENNVIENIANKINKDESLQPGEKTKLISYITEISIIFNDLISDEPLDKK